ncbi:MAG: hypothetical protein IID44_06505 [Planctomycetes bacterium]|nr:hypothetical protein [Planctomycetota bacterium]
MSTALLKERKHTPATIEPDASVESVARRVRKEFDRSGYAAVRRLTCECRRDVLTVLGRLPSFYQKQVAISLVMGCLPDTTALDLDIDVVHIS